MAQEEKKYASLWAIESPGLPVWLLVALGLALGLGWTLSSGFKRPPAQLVTSMTNVTLAWPYRGICGDLKVLRGTETLELSSRDIRRGLARLSFVLSPGEHHLTLHFQGLIPGLEREYPLTVIVDQDPPELSARYDEVELGLKNDVTTSESLQLSGHTEPGAQVYLESRQLAVDVNGNFETEVDLEPGWNHLFLAATDLAGNRTKLSHSLFRDVADPELIWQTRPDEVFQENTARIEFELHDDGKIAAVSGTVDGQHPIAFFAKADNRWVGTTPELHEGFHSVSVKAVDESGRVVASRRQILIDSSEIFGEATLGLGARGADVKLLHQRLAEVGFLAGDASREVFDKSTETALKKFQESQGFEVTGMAEGETLVALGPRIFINLSNFSLVLERPGQEPKRWLIASGTREFPTPVGRFVIVEKVIDPTWLPPKSEWAKDAKPTPPGPDNPLGTRWLGFDWGGVGIHGTNAPWTVGTAASHGCMRMVTEQVEELFELVEVGTPVTVLGGWESDDPLLERYWPGKKDNKEEVASN